LALASRLQVIDSRRVDIVGVDLPSIADPGREMDRYPAVAGAHLADDETWPDAENVHNQLRRLDFIGPFFARFCQLAGITGSLSRVPGRQEARQSRQQKTYNHSHASQAFHSILLGFLPGLLIFFQP